MSALALLLLFWPAVTQTPLDLSAVRAADLRAVSVATQPATDTSGLDRAPADVTSPDGQRIARVQPRGRGAESTRSRLIIIGPGSRRITLSEVINHFGTAWSADGSKIAYCSGANLHVADSNGRSIRLLRKGNGGVYPGACFDLAWSTDGRTLSFTEVDNAGQPDLSPPRRITITLGTTARR